MEAGDDAAWTLRDLGRIATAQGDVARGRRLLGDSLAQFRALGNRTGVAETLADLGRAALVQGDTTAAAAYFTESLLLFARVLGKQSYAAACLVGLSGVAGAQGQPVMAARLLGAADALCTSTSRRLPWVARGAYEQQVATLRQARLNAAPIATAWAEGRALTLEQAVADALEALPESS